MKAIKNIIFDFGSVLVDWNPHYLFDSYFGSVEKADYFLANICNRRLNERTDGGEAFADVLAELKLRFPDWKDAIQEYWDNWEKMMGKQIPGMYEKLQSLKEQGYRLYGLTNWSSETFYRIMSNYPIFKLLDGFVVSGDVKMTKPHPEIFHYLLDKYGIRAEESCFVDDQPLNVAGAQAIGIKGIVFKSAEELPF